MKHIDLSMGESLEDIRVSHREIVKMRGGEND
jgi:hypothetical protein